MIPLSSSFFFLLLLLLILSPLSLSTPFNISYHIDCGGSNTITDHYKTTWLSDRYFTGGSTSVVSEPLHFSLQPEKTLRFFPPTTSGPKNCYVIPTAPAGGRFLFRTFTVYDNYDGKNHPPSFEVSVEGTVVFSYHSPWPEKLSTDGSYSDVIAYVTDGDADVCFYSIATDPPIVGTLEVIQIDPAAYDSANLGNNSILVNYGRLSCGQDQWGPGLSNDTDIVGRAWQSDRDFRSTNTKVQVISVTTLVSGTNVGPNYFPMKLYQSAVIASSTGGLEYELNVDAKLDYLLWFHFAEIDGKVSKAGQRVFDVLVNGINVNRIDIYKAVGRSKAYDWHYVAKNLSSTTLTVKLVSVVGEPVLCGLENYAIVPNDLATSPSQVAAMRALKDSLRIPDRMGWNGDPCAPTTWNAWEGVTCRTNNDGDALVISQIDLGSQGLKGFVSDQISLLTNLVVLNLSSNSLTGPLPEGLGQQSLVKLDLSNNEFTGSIPESLASSRNLRLVLMNDNQLEGQVPEQIYSVAVHGGAIDLSANKGLCGVPSLPACPFLWRNGRLSSGGKIAIGISCTIFFVLLLSVIYICIRRKRNDYDFGLPHELMSMAAKRNRYHRQKSLMVLEMESQHAKGLIPTMKQPQ